MFLAPGPIIETKMQWKAFTACGGFATLASTICYSLNFQQEDENPRSKSKWISPADIAGESIIEFVLIGD